MASPEGVYTFTVSRESGLTEIHTLSVYGCSTAPPPTRGFGGLGTTRSWRRCQISHRLDFRERGALGSTQAFDDVLFGRYTSNLMEDGRPVLDVWFASWVNLFMTYRVFVLQDRAVLQRWTDVDPIIEVWETPILRSPRR